MTNLTATIILISKTLLSVAKSSHVTILIFFLIIFKFLEIPMSEIEFRNGTMTLVKHLQDRTSQLYSSLDLRTRIYGE